ncbi:MAG: hypothetical protein ACYDDF_07145 [Thermoplasmatota archaeon]
MADNWRGFERTALLSRARMSLEDHSSTDESLDLLDEMEGWDARSLYQWLYENDSDFEAEARSRVLSSRR